MLRSEVTLTCPQCGTSLDTISFEVACRSCGLRLADFLDLNLIDRATHTVAADVPCVTCQYNLRTIPVDSRCPECGTAVTASLRRGELRHANVSWLRRIRTGLILLAAGFAVSLVREALQLIMPRLLSPAFATYWLSYAMLSTGATLLLCLGCFAATHPESPEPAGRPMSRFRLLRFSAAGMLVLNLIGWSLPFVQFACVNGWTRLWQASLQEVFTSGGASHLHLALWGSQTIVIIAVLLLLNSCLRALAVRANRSTLRKILSALFGLLVIDSSARVAALVAFMSFRGTMSVNSPSAFFWYRSAYCAQQATDVLISIVMPAACLRLGRVFGRAVAGREQ